MVDNVPIRFLDYYTNFWPNGHVAGVLPASGGALSVSGGALSVSGGALSASVDSYFLLSLSFGL